MRNRPTSGCYLYYINMPFPVVKIALLGKDNDFDSRKKMEGRTAALRRSVQKAYDRATLQ